MHYGSQGLPFVLLIGYHAMLQLIWFSLHFKTFWSCKLLTKWYEYYGHFYCNCCHKGNTPTYEILNHMIQIVLASHVGLYWTATILLISCLCCASGDTIYQNEVLELYFHEIWVDMCGAFMVILKGLNDSYQNEVLNFFSWNLSWHVGCLYGAIEGAKWILASFLFIL